MTNNNAFQRPSKPSVKSIKKVGTPMVKKSSKPMLRASKLSVEQLASQVGEQCLAVLSVEDQGHRFYTKHRDRLDAHRADVLKRSHGKVVKCSATLAKRGEGNWGNLNLLLHVSINGVVVDHAEVYDELIDGLGIELFETFNFEARVYGYKRKNGEIAYGLKAKWLKLNRKRNEF